MTPNQYEPTKNTSAIKSLRQFSEALDVKYKTDVHKLGAAKAKRKAIRTGNELWSNIDIPGGHTKINQNSKEDLYNFILHHTQFVKYPISNYYIYESIDGNSNR